jgi:hypothetical protein
MKNFLHKVFSKNENTEHDNNTSTVTKPKPKPTKKIEIKLSGDLSLALKDSLFGRVPREIKVLIFLCLPRLYLRIPNHVQKENV